MTRGERMAGEEPRELLLPKRLREAQVQVVEVDGPGPPRPVRPPHPDLRMEHAAALRGGNRHVDVPGAPDRKPGQNGIAVVPAASDLDVREVDPVREMEQASEEIDLAVAQGALGP